MKGVIFNQLYEMIEKQNGEIFLEEVIGDAKLENDGAFTDVGTYNFEYLEKLILVLSQKLSLPIPVLVEKFGYFLGKVFAKKFPQMFQQACFFDFLQDLEPIIHKEVRKTYSGAQPPKFKAVRVDDDNFELFYISELKLMDLAKGLLKSSMKYFNEDFEIVEELISDIKPYKTLFYLKRRT